MQLKQNSLSGLPINISFPDIKETLSLDEINTSQETNDDHLEFNFQPASILVEEHEQIWANNDNNSIDLVQDNFIAWFYELPNTYAIGKIVDFTETNAFVTLYTDDGNGIFSIDPIYNTTTLQVSRENIILGDVIFTKKGTITKSTKKLIKTYFQHNFQQDFVDN